MSVDTERWLAEYSIYNLKAIRRNKINPLFDKYPPFPGKKYSIIYADPPWDYGGKMQYDKYGDFIIGKRNRNRKIYGST